MAQQDLERTEDRARLLTRSDDVDRLLQMMAQWWEGWSLARIADAHGLSRQRVAAILRTVACTRRAWSLADHERLDSHRRAPAQDVDRARAALLHPLAHRLTVRQRAALAWRAQGLILSDIARRMRTTPQNVRHFHVAARWRLERLVRRKRSALPPEAPAMPAGDADRLPPLDWAALTPGTEAVATQNAP